MGDEVCTACGERNAAGARFCLACGEFLDWGGEQPEPASTAAPPATPAPAAAVTPPVAAPAAGTPPAEQPSSTTPRSSAARAERPSSTTPDAATATATTAPACPQCGADNGPGLRFCRKCGHSLQEAATPGRATPVAPAELSWWGRLRPGDTHRRALRAAYRRGTPMRYRVGRVMAAVLAIGTVAGVLTFTGRDPIGWAKERIADIRGTLVVVEGVQASTDPPEFAKPEFPASNVSDNRSDTVWVTDWTLDEAAAAAACGTVPNAGSLILTWPESIRIHALDIAVGLTETDPARQQQWIPRLLELRSADGACQRVEVAADAAPQQIELSPVPTDSIRISVVAAYARAPEGAVDQVTIRELELFGRP